MSGRPSKPTALILGHRTNAEKNVRKNAEKALYTGITFKEQPQVKSNDIAHAEFMRLRSLYNKINYVDALDQQIINRYCLEVANLHILQDELSIQGNDLSSCEELGDRMKMYDVIYKTRSSMDKSKALLLKYEDRLFLNPAGRLRAIPKSPVKEADESGFDEFLKGRADAE